MYIEQAYKGSSGIWKYWIISTSFIILIAANYFLIVTLNIDVDELMRSEMEKKGSTKVFVEGIIPLVICFFIVLGWTKLVHSQTITSLTTSRKKIDWKRIFFLFILWGTMTVVLTGIDIYFKPHDFVWNFKPKPFFILAIVGIILIPLQTSFEEYLFRGHMMQGIGLMARNRWVPLVITSVLFGVMHLGNPEVTKLGIGIMVYYIGTGFFLGIITLMDEGLELALGFHAANNLIGALLLTADWTAFQTDSIFKDVSQPTLGWDVLIPILVVYPIILFILSKKYKWTNWKEKLTGKILSEKEFLNKEAQ